MVTGETAELPLAYALLGRVTAGMDVMDRIGVVPVGAEDRPVELVVIQRITMGGGLVVPSVSPRGDLPKGH